MRLVDVFSDGVMLSLNVLFRTNGPRGHV